MEIDPRTRKLRRRLRRLHSDLFFERDPTKARRLLREHAETKDALRALGHDPDNPRRNP